MQSRGLKRLLIFVVFLIPVAWYLILQLFGSNTFSLTSVGEIPITCEQQVGIAVIAKDDSLSLVETNYMNRVVFATKKRDVFLSYNSVDFFECVNQTDVDLLLVDEEGLWGSYTLSREGVDRLLTELDILILQKSYGQGTHR